MQVASQSEKCVMMNNNWCSASCQSELDVCYDEEQLPACILLPNIGYGKLNPSNFRNKSRTRTSPSVITLYRKGEKVSNYRVSTVQK